MRWRRAANDRANYRGSFQFIWKTNLSHIRYWHMDNRKGEHIRRGPSLFNVVLIGSAPPPPSVWVDEICYTGRRNSKRDVKNMFISVSVGRGGGGKGARVK
jgi:hypothetical protein